MLKYWLFYISVNLKFHYVRVAKMLAYYALKSLIAARLLVLTQSQA